MNRLTTPEFLKGLAFLSAATDDEVHQLAAAARVEHFPAGAVLFREGEHLRHICIVVDGNVAIEITGPDRRPRRIHTVGAGELLGWSPVLGQAAMTATARALTDVHAVALDAAAIQAICETDPKFGYAFMRRVANALAARLNATRLQLLDVFGTEIPAIASEGASS